MLLHNGGQWVHRDVSWILTSRQCCTSLAKFGDIQGLASAGLAVAGLENLFTFRAQPKNNNTRRDCFSLKKICAREVGKNAVEQSVHPKPSKPGKTKTTKREHTERQEQI